MTVPSVPGELEFGGAGLPIVTNLAVNGTFDADTDWTKGTGAAISGGELSYDGTQVALSATTQTASGLVLNRWVTVFFEITARSAGAVRVIAGNDASAWFSTPGVHKAILQASSGSDIGIEADADFIGSIDTVEFLQQSARSQFNVRPDNVRLAEVQVARRFRNTYGAAATQGAAGGSVAASPPRGDYFELAPGMLSGTPDPKPGVPGTAQTIAPGLHTDYHFKLWVIPTVLQLANPQLNTDIPFRIWNTWSDNETVSAILVNGSAVLSFNIGPGTVLRDGEYRTVNMQIGPGEPSIEATVSITTENLSGILTVLAAIADTFNLIPDVPVREKWDFLTDILVAHDGTEQRHSLRPRPRIEMDFTVEIINRDQRRQQWQLLSKNIRVQSLVPFYQYSTKLTATSLVGATKVFFDPTRTNMRAGEFLVIVNPQTEELIISRVTSVDPDGATLNSAITFDVTPAWIVAPAFNCILGDGSGITMNKVTGSLRVNAKTFEEPSLLRPGESVTLNTLDGLPILERRPLVSVAEDWSYRREVLDNETGVRDLRSRDLHGRVSGNRRFVIQRVAQPLEMDYWRKFFDTVRGAHKPFLLPTYFPDLTLVPGQTPLTPGASGFNVNEGDYPALYFPFNTWRYLYIEFESGAKHYARVLAATSNPDGTATLSFTPSLPNDAAYTVPSVISYLTKMRATDTIQLEHFADASYISFGVITTDEG